MKGSTRKYVDRKWPIMFNEICINEEMLPKHTHTHTHTHTQIYIYIYIYICMYVCMYFNTCMCVCICVCLCQFLKLLAFKSIQKFIEMKTS